MVQPRYDVYFLGLLNLFHTMEETDHVHLTFIKETELKQYQKNWPNHVFVALPEAFNEASDSTIKNVMKVCSYNS